MFPAIQGTGAIPGAGRSPANLVDIATKKQSQEFVEIAPRGHRRQRIHANILKIATEKQSQGFVQMETRGLQGTPGAHGGHDHEFRSGRRPWSCLGVQSIAFRLENLKPNKVLWKV